MPEAGGGVALRVEVDDQDPVAELGQARRRGSPRSSSCPRRPSGWRSPSPGQRAGEAGGDSVARRGRRRRGRRRRAVGGRPRPPRLRGGGDGRRRGDGGSERCAGSLSRSSGWRRRRVRRRRSTGAAAGSGAGPARPCRDRRAGARRCCRHSFRVVRRGRGGHGRHPSAASTRVKDCRAIPDCATHLSAPRGCFT